MDLYSAAARASGPQRPTGPTISSARTARDPAAIVAPSAA